MEHTEAIDTMAAERYLLEEMTPEDRDAFEEHFFGCGECAADVRDGAMVRAAVRTQKANRTRQPRRNVREWLTAAAIVGVIAGVPAIQNIGLRGQLARARTPHVVKSFQLTTAESRGAEARPVPVDAGGQPFTLYFEIPPQPKAQRYLVEARDASGRICAKDVVTAAAAGEGQYLSFPGGLSPGRYSLEVHAEPAGSPVPAWSFVVR
ncbi:MAG TPA: zf-HC2 domain-containing protein [Thermoanaerobaculia bacterium]|jgi:hypothetical protein